MVNKKIIHLVSIILITPILINIAIMFSLYLCDGMDVIECNELEIYEYDSSPSNRNVMFNDILILLNSGESDLNEIDNGGNTNNNYKLVSIDFAGEYGVKISIENESVYDYAKFESIINKVILGGFIDNFGYFEFKRKMLLSGFNDYSWWNIYKNITLLTFIIERNKSIPDGLVNVRFFKSGDIEGFLEEIDMDGSNHYYGLNFVVNSNHYNLVMFGFPNITEVSKFIGRILMAK